MSKRIKSFNLREGAFPIKMDLMFEDIDLQNIGRLKDSICGDIEISIISKDLFRYEGSINSVFIDKCQSCLKDIEVSLNFSSNLVIKDEDLMMDDDSNQDQTHYQNLEYFDIKQLIQEEVSLNYPNIVKCEQNCNQVECLEKEEKNLPFKKIRDLID
tara:strand:+ start:3224 stop:3694 length:471 start_codon:yes stop_codon:yes gene_type:complete